ncbi:unnamed protein product [Diabrotica balteata]|uniref:Soluble interferon alpha/beta receptor OPG204 n=1 Tax=Diabrotica balteata TaxID=107213 RepID=A0A9N9XCK4_DIABA|nr:unnamed protein product [Diabrotica balteata]
MAMFRLGFSVLLCLVPGIFGMNNFCNRNNFENVPRNSMQFSKEVNFREFAVVGNLKALHCCAKDYHTIEWYKDNKVYPWPLELSTMLLFPASANQTIYVQSVKPTDAGNYTCVLRNDTVLHSHTIQLRLFDRAPDDPQITYLSEDTVLSVGENLRLFCEAFVGLVDLPDAHSEVYWNKLYPNSTTYDELPSHIRHAQTEQEDGQTLGAYMIIDSMQPEDFGEYECVITKPGITIKRYIKVIEREIEVEYLDPSPLPIAKLAILMTAILCLFVAVVVLYLKFGLKVQVRLKDTLSPLEDSDGKEKDVLVVYTSADSELALGVLLPTLEEKYKYTCDSKELCPEISLWYKDLSEGEKYRRVIVVISPAMLEGSWDPSRLLLALKQLKGFGPNVIFISLKELPKTEPEIKNAEGETLSAVIRSLGVIVWDRRDEEKVWYLLRLKLPPKRTVSEKRTRGPDTRLRNNSQESIGEYVV